MSQFLAVLGGFVFVGICVLAAAILFATFAGCDKPYTKEDALQDEIESRKFDIRVREEARKLRQEELKEEELKQEETFDPEDIDRLPPPPPAKR